MHPAPVGPGSPAYEYVPLSRLDRATVRVVVAPFESVFVHMIDALTDGGLGRRPAPGRAPGSSPRWRGAVRSALIAEDVETLRPLTDPRTLGWPSCLGPPHDAALSFDEALEVIASRTGEELATAVVTDAAADRRALTAWQPVLRTPDRWLHRYVEALRRAWLGFEPLWRQASDLLDREFERVAAASARGATAHLVDALHPYSSIVDDQWRLMKQATPVELDLRDRQMVVAPLLAESVCITDCDDAGGLKMLHYPLPGAWRAYDRTSPPPDSLRALLGERKAILLQRLDRPLRAGDLAAQLGLGPSGVTHHLRSLEAAALIRRERRGRGVVVHRTARGSDLLALYDAP